MDFGVISEDRSMDLSSVGRVGLSGANERRSTPAMRMRLASWVWMVIPSP